MMEERRRRKSRLPPVQRGRKGTDGWKEGRRGRKVGTDGWKVRMMEERRRREKDYTKEGRTIWRKEGQGRRGIKGRKDYTKQVQSE
jgi:hypothetical protein